MPPTYVSRSRPSYQAIDDTGRFVANSKGKAEVTTSGTRSSSGGGRQRRTAAGAAEAAVVGGLRSISSKHDGNVWPARNGRHQHKGIMNPHGSPLRHCDAGGAEGWARRRGMELEGLTPSETSPRNVTRTTGARRGAPWTVPPVEGCPGQLIRDS